MIWTEIIPENWESGVSVRRPQQARTPNLTGHTVQPPEVVVLRTACCEDLAARRYRPKADCLVKLS
jgi:hypothetical protein